ncbi:MAG TPA: cation:proton antiporter [Actinomycetota bacterium]|nr:cation:proton antiporter [Actinomycetota bacterium]
MNLGAAEVARLLLALALLMIAAHGAGSAFARFRQPRVIGEILGGLLLGPTVLGALAPDLQHWLFPTDGSTGTVLGSIHQLGLLLLMYCSGTEIRTFVRRREVRTVASVLVLGTAVPFLAALFSLRFFHEARFFGPAGTTTSFLLIFGVAAAVTSIPVISRIMFDLGILGTPFARIVLGVAVLEDVVLYVVLAVALGIGAQGQGALFGLPSVLGLAPGSVWDVTYHAVATLGVLGAFLLFGPRVYAVTARLRYNLIRKRSPLAYQLLFMLVACLACAALGIQAFFGAFLAGIVVGAATRGTASADEGATAAIGHFSFAFFIPVYFAIVGLQLDLLRGFDPLFFVAFLTFACLVKAASVYAGARVGGQPPGPAMNLAVAMNARGGPGIVLASVAFGAGIIDRGFYAVLVLLAVLTSLFAGSWLERIPRDRLLVDEDTPDTLTPTA